MSFSSTERAGTEVLVEMPQMGVSVAEGTVAVWHKHEGDWVSKDEILCEISTDKIDTDLPSPVDGRVAELLVAENQTVTVGTPLARIASGAAGEHPRAPGPELQMQSPSDEVQLQAPPVEVEADRAAPHAGHDLAAPSNGARGQRSHRFYSSVVQRIAAEHEIDLTTVPGTGRGGRVRKQDVLAAAAARTRATAPVERRTDEREYRAPEPQQPEPQQREPQQPEPLRPEHAAAGAASASTDPRPEPLSRMRRAIAEHMTRSLRTAAHCTTIIEADFSRVEAARARLNCSPLPFVARASVEALERHPALNATLDGDMLTRHRDINLGIAVSLGERGLIVPVLRRAQEFSAEGLAVRIRELALAARENTLTPDDVRGGTFTITNPGGFGSLASTPIINQPQVAILDLEAVVKRPVAVTDSEGNDAIAVRPMAYLCLSWDHRALDGALAAQFLATLRDRLEGEV